MKIVSIDKKLIQLYSGDPEFLHKTGRPCVLVVRLKYKGRNYKFAIPFRSNISSTTPRNQFFPLPPRTTTKPKNHHGIHYIKMFPVKNEYLQRYRTQGNKYAIMIQKIVNRNEKDIINACQEYLARYEAGEKPQYSTNIDYLINKLYK